MSIPVKKAIDYELVKCDNFIDGVIEEIQEEQEHKFNYKGEEKVSPAVRFVFSLTGYQHKHYSRWMSFTYGEKANLYKKYLIPLVDGAFPDMPFDIQELKGMKVKTLWVEEKRDTKVFQHIETIRPQGEKYKSNINQVQDKTEEVIEEEPEIPF